MKMYDELAPWWPLLSSPDEYEEEAAFYLEQLRRGCQGPLTSVLELGSGGGNNASHLKPHVGLVLVEPSAGMRRVSEALNPECAHVAGDMRTVRLPQLFDGVFVHDAVAYMASRDDLRRAIDTAYLHTRPGGAALFAPDHVRETFRPSTDCGGHDAGVRGMRFLEWVWDPNPDDDHILVDYVLTLREADGEVRVVHDRHLEGLFSRDTWLTLLKDAGFAPEVVPFDHTELEPGTYQVFVARRPLE